MSLFEPLFIFLAFVGFFSGYGWFYLSKRYDNLLEIKFPVMHPNLSTRYYFQNPILKILRWRRGSKLGDEEIARVEVPQWVASNNELLILTHSLILDQCRRGHGYPVVLSEAHEQAVVTGADRENFWELVESLMVNERLPNPGSAKSFSKRTRWV